MYQTEAANLRQVRIHSVVDFNSALTEELLSVAQTNSFFLTFQSNNERHFKVDILERVDDAIGNSGTVDDATKHVDKDAFNCFVFS